MNRKGYYEQEKKIKEKDRQNKTNGEKLSHTEKLEC